MHCLGQVRGGVCPQSLTPRFRKIRGHAPCWATRNPSLPGGVREQTTLERWHKVHSLLRQGVGLLECSRRLNLALNTVSTAT